MSTSENGLNQSSKDVFAKPLLQDASLLTGIASLGIESTTPTNNGLMLPSPPLTQPPSATPLSLTSPSPSSVFPASTLQPTTAATLPLTQAAGIDPLTGSPTVTRSMSTASAPVPLPQFSIMAEGTVSVNSNSDFDGVASDLTDDALIYAGQGFTFNGQTELPVQRDSNGNPLRDAQGRAILRDNAVTVSSTYTLANVSASNRYSGLVPPTVIPTQTVEVPAYATVRQQELDRRIPSGTATVTFNAAQNPLNNAADWNRLFPASGTATRPSVVRVTGGGLTIPSNITLSHTIITVENGDINFNGNGHTFNNVVLITNNGNINLSNVQSTDLAVFAAGGINMNNGARFNGKTTLASNGGDINFNGATSNTAATQQLQVISQRNITFNGSADTRGTFRTAQTFTYNGNSSLIGSIGAKGNIIFNGRASVIGTAPSDTVAPTITAMLERDTAPNGSTNTDRLTADATIVGQVTDAGTIVEFKAGLDTMPTSSFVNVLPQRQADGTFRLTRSQLEQINGAALADGLHTLKLQARDQAGNLSSVYEFTFTLDTKAPIISSPDLNAASDSGRSNTDNLTNTSRPQLEGTAEAGAIVRLYQNSQLIGQTTATAQGTWQFQPGPLNDGQYRFTTTAEDAAGNVSAESAPLLVTIDTIVDAPLDLDLVATSDSGQSNTDNITNQTAPVISGRAEANTTIKLYRDTQVIGEATTNANGSWQVATIALDNGTHAITATATDAAGNVSGRSTPLTIVIDAVQPTLSLTTPITVPVTQASKLIGSVDGTGSAIASATYFFDGGVTRSIVLDAAGRFDQAFDLTGVANGSRVLTIVTTDVAGNVRTTQLNVVVAVDTDAPVIAAQLVRDTAPDNQTNQDVITFDPTIAGTVRDANRIVEFQARFSNTAPWMNILAQRQPDGSFTLTRSQLNLIYGSAVPDGTYTLQLQAKDEFGNTTVFGLGFTLDTIVAAPANLQLTASSDTGASAADRITRVATPMITGIAEPNARVQLFEGTTLVGQTTVTEQGTWQLTTTALSDGVHTLMAIATDIAGNISVPSQPLSVTIDAVLPALTLAPAIDLAPLKNGARLSGTINGTGSAITQIQYRWNDQPPIPININAAGAFDQALNFAGVNNGLQTLTITAIDAAGNASTNTFNVTVALDFDAPTATATLLNDTAIGGTANQDRITSDPTITGTLLDASEIVAFRASVDSANPSVDMLAAVDGQGRFTLDRARLEQILGSTLSDGAHTVYLQAVDQYNNVSQIFEVSFVLDTSLALTVTLDPAFDSAPVGDSQTIAATVSLSGQAEAGAIVKLVQTGTTVIADANGRFGFDNVALALGDNTFTVVAEDIAGNRVTTPLLIKRLATNQAPTDILLSHDTISENSATGTLVGTLGTIDPDLDDTHQYTLLDSANGRFQLIGNELRVAPGVVLDYETTTSYTVKVRTTDSGKPNLFFDKVLTIQLSDVNDRPVFASTPISNAEVGQTYSYTITTVDPENGTRAISANNLPSWLTLIDNGDGTATLTGTPTGSQTGLYPIELTVTDIGGLTSTQTYLLGVDLVLREGFQFRTSQSVSFNIDRPRLLSFTIDPSFDLVKQFINDAFEVALIDAQGRSLVPTIAPNREVFFNWTEGESIALGSGATYNSATKTVTLNLMGIPKNTEATLVFRLVNNDQDTGTQVRIRDLQLLDAPAGTLPPVISYSGATNPTIPVVPNFKGLEDISSSMSVEYDQTSYDAAKKLLYTKVSVKNSGTYSVDVPLLVAVSRLSDPSVLVRNPDGFTPEGLPYYDFSQLVADGKFDPSERTGDRSLVFYNPNGVQFTYDLVVLAQLNQAPTIQSEPIRETIAGKPYQYAVQATDPNQDVLSYRLLSAPEGMTINTQTGVIDWIPAANTQTSHAIVVQVSDGRDGIAEQSFTLTVTATSLNRPPRITSTPVVDAQVRKIQGGRIIVANDEWPLSITGFDFAPVDAKQFAQNIANYFVNDKPGQFLAYSDNFGITNTLLAQAFREAGHQLIASTTINFTLETLQQFDGVFLGGFPANNQVLIDYVNSGGNVYLVAGTGRLGNNLVDAPDEARAWQPFLNAFGLQYDFPYNGVIGVIPLDATPHPIFENINLLYQVNGNSIIDLNLADDRGVIVARSRSGEGLYAVYDSNFSAGGSYKYDVAATDADQDTLRYSLITAPDGMWIDPTNGVIRWFPATSQIGLNPVVVKVEDGKGGSAEQSFKILVKPETRNHSPIIISEANTTAYTTVGYTYQVQALDADQDTLTYSLLSAPSGMLIDPTTGNISWDAPIVGTHSVSIKVIDELGGIDSQSFQVNVSSMAPGRLQGSVYLDVGESVLPQSPVSGLKNWIVYLDQNGNSLRDPGETYTLTDSKGNYGLDVLPGSYQIAVEKQPGWLQTSPSEGIYNVTLASAQTIARLDFQQTNSWIKGAENLAPTFTSIPTATITSNQLLLYRATATDLNADDLVFDLVVKPAGMTISPSGALAWRPRFDQVGTHDVVVRVQDGRGGVDLQSFRVNVKPENRAPIITSIAPSTPPQAGKEFRYQVKALDLDGDTVHYELVQELTSFTSLTPTTASIDPVTGILTWRPTSGEGLGSYYYTQTDEWTPWQFKIRATDGHGGEAYQTIEYFLDPAQPNRAPTITSTPRTVVRPGGSYFYRIEASDPDGDTLSYALASAPPGMMLNDGILTWVPSANQTGAQIVEVQVSDGTLTVQQQYTLNVVSQLRNQAPTIVSAPGLTTNLEKTYEYNLIGEDPDGDVVLWTLDQAPDGMVIDSLTGALRWQPKVDQVGDHSVTVRIADSSGTYSIQQFTLKVTGTNAPPMILSVPITRAAQNQVYRYNAIAADPENSALTFSLGRRPIGMTIDDRTGTVSWISGGDNEARRQTGSRQ